MSTSKLSVQLYTVRELLTEDTAGTLKRIADLGFTQVEPFAFLSFGDDLARRSRARPASARRPPTRASSAASSSRVFEAAKALGIETVIDPFVAPERWQTAESVDEIAAQLNAAAEVAAGYGVRVGYHNHAHETREHDRRRHRPRVLREQARPGRSCSRSTPTGSPSAATTRWRC